MQTTHIRVASAEAGHPLIAVLAARLAASRNRAKRVIDGRRVFVNGRRVWMARHTLQAGDDVEVHPEPAVPRGDRAHVLWQDADYLVADKPPGIETNGPGSQEESLRASLKIAGLTAVHRLDRDTSGCLLFAKNPAAEAKIIPLFAKRLIDKTYHAIVRGQWPGRERVISRPLDGAAALTRVQTLDANRLASHLLVTIKTGRTHQIRLHLRGIGHPVVGDRQYAIRRELSALERAVPRQMLHAQQLGFKHPLTGASVRCAAPLPHDFRECLKIFRLK